jgi:hypothetical protein
MPKDQRHSHLLYAMSNDRLGVSGQLSDVGPCGRLGSRCQHYMLRLSPPVVDLPTRGEDEQALHEHLPCDWRDLHECKCIIPVFHAVVVRHG